MCLMAGAGRALMRANLGEMYIFATFRPIIDFLSSLSLGVILYVGAVRHLGGVERIARRHDLQLHPEQLPRCDPRQVTRSMTRQAIGR